MNSPVIVIGCFEWRFDRSSVRSYESKGDCNMQKVCVYVAIAAVQSFNTIWTLNSLRVGNGTYVSIGL